MTAPVYLNVEQRLEILDVLVVNAEQRFQASGWKLDLLQMTTTSSLVMDVLYRNFEVWIAKAISRIRRIRKLLHGRVSVNRRLLLSLLTYSV